MKCLCQHTKAQCDAQRYGMGCTLETGHGGFHVACGIRDEHCLSVWCDENDVIFDANSRLISPDDEQRRTWT